MAQRKFVKFGYSQHEVWNWLHREDVNANQISVDQQQCRHFKSEVINSHTQMPNGNLESVGKMCQSCQKEETSQCQKKTFEVKFSAFEFLAASSRLSSLNLEGLENFVSNMLEKAIDNRQRQLIQAKQKQVKEKNSNFWTIRNQHPKQESTISTTNNNNYHLTVNHQDDVLLLAPPKNFQNASPHNSCVDCQEKVDTFSQTSVAPSLLEKTSQNNQVLSSHNYQTLCQIDPFQYNYVGRNATRAYTTLEALDHDKKGKDQVSITNELV
jgi:hypothetical protein